MFGKTLPDGSAITAQIKLRLGSGHPILAWSGAPNTKDEQVIKDISSNENISKYLYRAIGKNKIKPDEYGSVIVPAYLLAVDDEVTIEEHQIEMTLTMVSPEKSDTGQSAIFDKLFAVYSSAMEKMAVSHVQGIEKLSQQYSQGMVEAHKTLAATATQSAKMMEAAVEPFNKTLAMMSEAYTHESKRADAASDAVVRMLNAKTQAKPDDLVDDVVKLIGAAPMLVTLIDRLKGGK